MLSSSELPLFKMAKIICEQHHEKYDGTGYPNRLKKDEIHIYARIVAIADVFDALSHKRSYKRVWSMEEVLAYMKEMREKHFDPHLIDIFFENINQFLEIYNTNVEQKKLEQLEVRKSEKNPLYRMFTWLLNKR
jgi:response regulator RpfG family c-di-GMP phosphodiesterase